MSEQLRPPCCVCLISLTFNGARIHLAINCEATWGGQQESRKSTCVRRSANQRDYLDAELFQFLAVLRKRGVAARPIGSTRPQYSFPLISQNDR